MSELETTGQQPELSPQEEENGELSFFDKMVGVLTEPGETFKSIANYPLKTVDWLVPFAILLVVVIVSMNVIMSDPVIKNNMQQEQIAKIEEQLQEQVEAGELTQAQAEQRMEMIRGQMEQFGGTTGKVIQGVSILIMGFIIFFVVSGVYFALVRLIFKDKAPFKAALVANGLTAYIGILQMIVTVILSLTMSEFIQSVSPAAFMDVERTELVGYALSKLDIFSIWAYVVLGIGLAKLFKSDNIGKYIGLVIAVWLIWSAIAFALAKAVPMLSGLIQM